MHLHGTSSFSSRALAKVLIVATLTCAAAAQASDKVRWKMQAAYGSNLPALGDTIPGVMESLNKASGGRIMIKHYEPNKLAPTLDITEAVKSGKIEAGYTWLGYDQGRIASSVLFSSVPFGMEPWEYIAWWYEGEGRQMAEDVYHRDNIHPVLCGLTGPETAGWFKKEINDLEDIKGLKVRFAGIGGQIMQDLGASVTVLPGGEIFQALEKGAIDATEFSLPAVDQKLGFNKVAKYNYFPGWHQPHSAFHLVVNKQEWDAVSDSDKEMINMACQAGVTRDLARSEAIQGRAMEQLEAEGAAARRLPENILRSLQEVTKKVLDAEAAKDADFKKVYENQLAFEAQYKRWKQLGYLPRDF
ncbi:TRAP transporter substrate-binding protein [Hahella sp. KA22]|uniref:TRAP transporter substrate-binding protein n=1 Tax=Hahella sp. KA22 TaxID=1628392 RepID=UPI000FDD3B91|nr:TRAP transporter substrate-binding protein [Hahella sp. KA22]AZZ93170.1 TRAP transporter substrate-binding protein [Hahella sp. KA22]QAY56543.1 TRAP transporter substrate-binding protein [Hahella sp. KA22]